MQSATITTATTPGVVVNAASASGGAVTSSARTTLGPWTCFSQRGSDGSNARNRARFSRTASGASPASSPTFMPPVPAGGTPQGPVETPPARVVISARTRPLTGQPGRIQPGSATLTGLPLALRAPG